MKPVNFVKLMGVSICLLSFLFLTQGCLNDDLSVCGVRLSFNYTETPDGDNRFASDVRKANVYIFDATTGVFVDEYSATFEQLVDGHILPINLAVGEYDFITWGNIGDQFEKTSFVSGETTFDEARITLKALDNTIREYPDSMYYGNMRATVKASDLVLNQEIDLRLVKNNKRINVTTRGLYDETSTIDDPSTPSFYCLITSKNGTYKFDNYPTGEQYKYITHDSIAHNEEDSTDITLRSNFVVLREFSNNALTDSRLKIINSNGNTRQEGVAEEEFLDVSLTECLNTVVVAGGPPIEDIEEFDIEIIISWTNGTYSVTINDWEAVRNGGVVLY